MIVYYYIQGGPKIRCYQGAVQMSTVNWFSEYKPIKRPDGQYTQYFKLVDREVSKNLRWVG